MKKVRVASKATASDIREALNITKETSDDIQKLLEHLFPNRFQRKGKVSSNEVDDDDQI